MPVQNLPGLILDRAHPLARGLVGWWPMNEGGGGLANNAANSQRPAVGQSSMLYAGSIHGTAAKLSGAQYYAVANAPELNLTAGGSLCFWGVYTVTLGADASYWGIAKDYAGNRSYAFGMYSDFSSVPRIALQINGVATILTASTRPLQTGVPYFYCATGDSATGWKAYQNGTIDVSAAWSAPTSLPSTSVTIGRREYASPYEGYWVGSLWNARIYNRALSAAEVARLYTEPFAGALAPSNPRRYYIVPTAAPPAVPTRPLSADRLNNRTFARNWRRGETG